MWKALNKLKIASSSLIECSTINISISHLKQKNNYLMKAQDISSLEQPNRVSLEEVLRSFMASKKCLILDM